MEDEFDFTLLAEKTHGYSSSDLKELCRNAAMIPVRESIRTLDGEIDKANLKVCIL